MEKMFLRVQAELSNDELQQFLTLVVKVGKALQGTEKKENGTQDAKLRKIEIDD